MYQVIKEKTDTPLGKQVRHVGEGTIQKENIVYMALNWEKVLMHFRKTEI